MQPRDSRSNVTDTFDRLKIALADRYTSERQLGAGVHFRETPTRRWCTMITPMRATVVMLCLGHAIAVPLLRAQESAQSEREAMYDRYREFSSYVKGGSVEPHWMADGSSFWYAEGAPENTVIYKVDPKANTKTELFDTARLRQAITPLLDHEPAYEGLPFEEFTFVDEGEKEVTFSVEKKEFILWLDTYRIRRAPSISEEEKNRLIPKGVRKSFMVNGPDLMEVLSPDRRWFASLKDDNLWLRSTYDDGSVQLTTDAIEDYVWGGYWDPWAWWSPDSYRLAVKKTDYRSMPKYAIVDYLSPREEVRWSISDSDPEPPAELFIVDIVTKQLVRVDTGTEPDQYFWVLGWRPDGSELLFLRPDPWTTKLDLMAANPSTGSTRIVLTESRTTYGLWLQWERLFTPLKDGARFIWRSERDGWNHLYLYDLDGNLIRRLTEGLFPVLQVVAVDDKAGWVYFTAHGDPQRPYDTHLYRVDLEGNRLARLTEANGQHDIQFAPSKEFFLDTHSNVDRPPAVELKRADGTLLQTVSKANIDALKELKWKPPEEFVVKAADGETDLYGVLYKPYDFDPNKKYPVIDKIYGGAQTVYVPRTFSQRRAFLPQARAQLGFIVFTVDARGTPERGREFQEVVYGNLGRNEIPDHVAALKQLAETRPYMDLSRVGIHGNSFGGYFAIRAMLLAPNVYHVGVARAAYNPFRPDDDVLMGSKEALDYASNLNFAANLKGKLLLIHGTSDADVPFSNAMKMVDALIQAGKHFDLLVLPGAGHRYNTGTSLSDRTRRTYVFEAIRRYFQEHLKPELGSEPGRTGGR